jgi:hypothetical protein
MSIENNPISKPNFYTISVSLRQLKIAFAALDHRLAMAIDLPLLILDGS